MSDSFYKYHVFFCTNQREAGEGCCENFNAAEIRGYAKQRVKELGDQVSGNVRINTAGCLNRCDQGPVMVVYPEATWYTYVDREDVDEIIEEHLIKGNIVKRLQV
ncbi:MAG: NAD(P)H-dependent oxidoreductase subunit E [Gammaproteobacteria bacterium]|nr:NAD(P)H-dependent oxidoreductase subunit E [Gammaproteobacteria bacterium]